MIKPPVPEGRDKLVQGPFEILKIAFAIPGLSHAHDVMEIIGPHSVEILAATLFTLQHLGLVPGILRDSIATSRMDLGDHLGEDVRLRGVDDRVRRIEAESIYMEMFHPIDRIAPEETADDLGKRPI